MSFESEVAETIEQAKPKLSLVPPPVVVPPMFEQHVGYLSEALEGTFHRIEDVVEAVAGNRAQFWPGKASAMVTEIETISNTKIIRVWIAGGDMSELVAMAPGIEAWARLNGCTQVLIEGRKGWERIMKAFGYDPWLVTLRKAL